MTIPNSQNKVDVRDFYNRSLNTSSEHKRTLFEQQVLSDLEELGMRQSLEPKTGIRNR